MLPSRALLLPVLAAGFAGGCDAFPPIAFNRPPEAGRVVFQPDDPTTDDLITALVEEEPWDPDGGELTVTWTFTCDGVPVDAPGRVIAASDTTKGQTWVVDVVASDGEWTSDPFGASVLIRNTPPVATFASISPDAPTTDDDLALQVAGQDADGDVLSWRIEWSVDGRPATEFDGFLTIPAAETSRSEVWSASVRPFDGEDAGDPLVTDVRVDNTVPVIGSVRVIPYDPTVGESICAVLEDVADEDGDEVTVTLEWTLDGVTVQTDVLDPGDTGICLTIPRHKGQAVQATATPDDGFATGATVTSEPVVVLNTAPTVKGATISPSTGTEATTFTCLPQGEADIDGDVLSYTYDWTVSGSLLGLDEASLTGSRFQKNDVITCTITVHDDETPGGSATSSAVTVGNSPPSLTSVAVSPGAATVQTTLAATPSGWSDVDGDSASYLYLWYANGEATSETGSSFSCSSVARGDVVHVEVTPWDGTDEGTPVESDGVTIDNSEPSISSVTISPSVAYTDSTLTATPSGWFDADDDPEACTYAWRVAGRTIGETGSTLSGDWFERGDNVVVTVTPYDDYDTGPVRTGSITISNYTPEAVAVLLDDEPVESCSVASFDASGSSDGDDDELSYTWTITRVPSGSHVDSTDLDSTTSATPSFLVDAEGSWTLRVVVGDSLATDATTVTFDSEWRAENADPVADAGAYDDESTYATCYTSGSGHTCSRCASVTVDLDAGASTDDDGDPLYYAWTVSTSPSGAYTSLSDDEDPAPTLTIQNLPASYGVTTPYIVSAQVLVVDCAGGYDVSTATFTVGCTGL